MTTGVTLYPIYAVTHAWQDDPFDHTKLPAQIVKDVTIERVDSMFNEQTFSWISSEMGKQEISNLKGIQFAIVHRFQLPAFDTDQAQNQSAELVNKVAACLRVIRPMRQFASLMAGSLRADGTIDIQSITHPDNLMDVPEVQKTFALRNKDVSELQTLIDEFLRAMNGQFWKFRMSVSFHESGHFAVSYWKSRFMLWCSAVEAIFTSQRPDHQGSKVAKERIKWFLGAGTSIYMPGDFQSFMPKASYAIGDIVDDLYEVRNYVAHGERIPDRFFTMSPDGYLGENGSILTILHDGLSFIIRASLLRILKNNLLQHFVDGPTSEMYFGAAELTNSALNKRAKTSP